MSMVENGDGGKAGTASYGWMGKASDLENAAVLFKFFK